VLEWNLSAILSKVRDALQELEFNQRL
jgi:hypothetical protein